MLTEIPNISCFYPKSPPISRWARRKARRRQHQHLCSETTTKSYLCNGTVPSLFHSKRTRFRQEEEGELVRRGRREGWRRRTSDWKSRCPDSALLWPSFCWNDGQLTSVLSMSSFHKFLSVENVSLYVNRNLAHRILNKLCWWNLIATWKGRGAVERVGGKG